MLLWLLLAGPALAHKLNVFAAADGRQIQGEVYFSRGGKPADVPVQVRSAAGEVIATLRTAADGSFAYATEAPVEHVIVAETPDGHRAEWRIRAEELVGAFPAAEAADTGAAPGQDRDWTADPAAAADPAGDRQDAKSTAQSGTSAASEPLDPALVAAIERAVARQVRPLREEALAARDAAQFRDVLGGIGYIVGLAGLGLWWRCRRSRAGL